MGLKGRAIQPLEQERNCLLDRYLGLSTSTRKTTAGVETFLCWGN
jgi:hypothetical protein